MEEHQQIRLVEARTKLLETQMILARSDIDKLQEHSRDTQADLRRMILVLDGDEDLGLLGLIERSRTTQRAMYLGLAITSLTGLATLAAILFQIISR